MVSDSGTVFQRGDHRTARARRGRPVRSGTRDCDRMSQASQAVKRRPPAPAAQRAGWLAYRRRHARPACVHPGGAWSRNGIPVRDSAPAVSSMAGVPSGPGQALGQDDEQGAQGETVLPGEASHLLPLDRGVLALELDDDHRERESISRTHLLRPGGAGVRGGPSSALGARPMRALAAGGGTRSRS